VVYHTLPRRLKLRLQLLDKVLSHFLLLKSVDIGSTSLTVKPGKRLADNQRLSLRAQRSNRT
jgi:hypothetical protein